MSQIWFVLAVAMALLAVASTCRFAAAVREAGDSYCVEYRLDHVGRAIWHMGLLILSLCVFVILVRA